MSREQIEQQLDLAIDARENARTRYAESEIGSAERLIAVALVANWSMRVNSLRVRLTGEVLL